MLAFVHVLLYDLFLCFRFFLWIASKSGEVCSVCVCLCVYVYVSVMVCVPEVPRLALAVDGSAISVNVCAGRRDQHGL